MPLEVTKHYNDSPHRQRTPNRREPRDYRIAAYVPPMTHYHFLTPATKDKSDSYLTAILTDLYGPGVILIRSRDSILWGRICV